MYLPNHKQNSEIYEESVFAYGAGVGIGFNITDGLGMDIGGRYMMASVANKDVSMFSGAVGLRYTF